LPDLQLIWQPSLFEAAEVTIDEGFSQLERIHLDPSAWVDYQPGWVGGSERLFEELLISLEWGQRTRHMYDNQVLEPRLTSLWTRESGMELLSPVESMRRLLAERYEVDFDSAGFNLYRDGRDSVAWHGDRISKEIENPIVALVSLGESRRFLLRREEGRSTRTFTLNSGDLLVTGGTTQRTWQHSVPKVARAGPRISIAFRHGLLSK
jgi:alkylated DNA repair dioxygenase AlkB